MSFTPVSLTPTPGFCIKTHTLQPGILAPPSTIPASATSTSPGGLLEPEEQAIPVPKGTKVFVNIAWDKNVPPPPEGSEEAIQKAMKGEEDGGDGDKEGWYVPVVVSEPRQDKDKAGNPSLVVDCVYNSGVKNRTLRDPEFKVFLVELGLQRIEAQTGLTLSRQIGTPNIAAKGKLLPRTVKFPTSILSPAPLASKSKSKSPPATPATPATPTSGAGGVAIKHPSAAPSSLDKNKDKGKGKVPSEERTEDEAKRPLIEEVVVVSPPTKGILKKTQTPAKDSKSSGGPPASSAGGSTVTPTSFANATEKEESKTPLDASWRWEKLDSGRLRITMKVPGLTAQSIASGKTTLDVEERRILLSMADRNEVVDIDRMLSDAQLVSGIHGRARERASVAAKRMRREGKGKDEIEGEKERIMEESDKEVTSTLFLKRERVFDVDGAQAEWRVAEGILVVTL